MAKLSVHAKSTTGLNSGAKTIGKKMLITEIKKSLVFEALLPINEKDLMKIIEDMKINGFDESQPVHIWDNTLIDGHTRFEAAQHAELQEIVAHEHHFKNENEAIEYALKAQLNRRNLNDAGKIVLIEKLDNLKKTGRPTSDSDDENLPAGKSSEVLAETLGVSSRTIERGRAVLKNADDETLEKVKSGDISINKAYKKIKEKNISETVDEAFNIDLSDEVDEVDTSILVETEEDPYTKKITLYDEILSMDITHLAAYFHSSVQEQTLSVSEWEEKLKNKDLEI